MINIEDLFEQKKSLAFHLHYIKINLSSISKKEKAEKFNNFFADQCSILRKKSDLLATISKKTRESLTTIGFSNNDILKIIRNLDPKKDHSHDIISIRIVKI